MSTQQFITPADRTVIDTLPATFQGKTAISRFVPTTGGTVTIPNTLGDSVVIIAPATDIATLTIVWPTTPFNGQNIRILSTANIAAITHSGGSLNRSVVSLPASGDMNFVYDLGGLTYMCDGVTLSPVVSLPYSAVTASGAGNAVFFSTDSGLVGGNAIFVTIQHIQASLDVADPNVAFGKPVVSNSNKTVTTNVQKQTFNGITLLSTNIIGSNTIAAAPNGVALTFLVHGILA